MTEPASQAKTAPIFAGAFVVTGPFNRSGDSPYYRGEKDITKTFFSKAPGMGIHETLQDELKQTGKVGVLNTSTEVVYQARNADKTTETRVTRNYHAASLEELLTQHQKEVEDAFDPKTVANFPHRYEMAETRTETEKLDQTFVSPFMDIDCDVPANSALLREIQDTGFIPTTPLLDECLPSHPDSTLKGKEVDQGCHFIDAGIAILKTVTEGFLAALLAELGQCELFESIEFTPEFFSSCTSSKISFHVLIRVTATLENGERVAVVFPSLADFKLFYRKCINEQFGEIPAPTQKHPFMEKRATSYDTRRTQELSIVFTRTKSSHAQATAQYECVLDESIASKNRVIRMVYSTKTGRRVPKLPFLYGDDGRWYACNFPFAKCGEMDDIFDEDSSVCAPYTGMRYLLRSLLSYTPPNTNYYMLSDSRKSVLKRKLQPQTKSLSKKHKTDEKEDKEERSPDCEAVELPNAHHTFDTQQFCSDFSRMVESSVWKIQTSILNETLVFYCTNAKRYPCRIFGSIHSSNNFYYSVVLENGELKVYQKCFASRCKIAGRGFFCKDFTEALDYKSYIDDSKEVDSLTEKLFGSICSDDESEAPASFSIEKSSLIAQEAELGKTCEHAASGSSVWSIDNEEYACGELLSPNDIVAQNLAFIEKLEQN